MQEHSLFSTPSPAFIVCRLFWWWPFWLVGEGNGNPLQYSYVENPVDRGAWWAAGHRIAQSQTRLKRLSMHVCIGEGNGSPLQYSCLENPRIREAWWAAIRGVTQSQTPLKWLSSSSILTGVRWYFIVLICIFLINEWCWASFHVFVSHLWRNVFLGLFPTFWLGCLFSWYWVIWAACIFWKLILFQLFHLLLFSPTLRVVFSPCL